MLDKIKQVSHTTFAIQLSIAINESESKRFYLYRLKPIVELSAHEANELLNGCHLKLWNK